MPSGQFAPSRPSADLMLTTMAMALEGRVVAVVVTDEATSEVFSVPSATIEHDTIHPRVVALADVAGVVAEHAQRRGSRPQQ